MKTNTLNHILSLEFSSQLSLGSSYLLQEPLGPNLGIQAQLPILLAEYTFRTSSDIKDYFSLLADIPEYFQSILEFEEKKAEEGLFMSDVSADRIIQQCQSFMETGTENYLYSMFNQRVEELLNSRRISRHQADSFIEMHDKLMDQFVFPAYLSLSQGLEELKGRGKNTGGLAYLDGGKDYYKYLVQSTVGDYRSLDEILQSLLLQLQEDYANLTSDYDTLNVQLDAEREKVEQLIERIQQTDATNRAKIRQYEKELGTLRSIMKHYIYQIDSLNTLNTELRADAAKAREEAAESQRKYEEAVKVTEDLSSKVEQGQVVKGRGITLEALNRSGNVTNRHSRVEKLRTSLSLVENEIAEKGWRRVYVRVKDPSGFLLVEKPDQQFEFEGASLYYSSSREVDYNGNELDIVIYFSGETEYVKGVYTVEVYTDEALLGTADMLLK